MKIKMVGVAFLALMAVMVAVAVPLPRSEPALAQDAGICGRTQQVREAILAKLDGISGCSDVTAEDLAGITGRLLLENVGLSSLISFDFDGLFRLTQLSISNTEDATKLNALPSGIFDDLTRLQVLQLVATDLSELPEGVFDELEALQLLEVTDANLTRLPDGVFDNATALKSIRLSRNNITVLPEGVFDELTNLEILLIERNQLASLPDGIFDEVTALRVLFLSRNNIAVLPEGVLDELSNLEVLLIESNQFTSLPDGIFDELTALKALFFFRNDLAELRNGVFDELTSLEQLSFSGKFTSLPVGVFDELTRLKQLQIEESELTSLPSGVFDNLSDLTQLYLGNNALTVLEEGVFDEVPKLTSLYLHQNEFVELPEGMFKGLTELEILKIHENPGAPFTIYAELEQRGQGVVVKVTEGAPFDMTITLSATGGTLDATSVAVAGGSLESAVSGVTASGDDLVTVSVESSVFDLADLLGALTAPGSSLTLTSNTPASGVPTIRGTVQVGQTLAADVSGIADADGLDNVSFSYQWLSSSDTEIEGATSSTYTLQTSDEGKAIKVKVSFTDAQNQETRTSAATAAVAAAALTPLTASIHSEPASHDGQAEFTFELRFSENLEGFSYQTLQEHAFTVNAGEVVKARRLESGKNIRWEIRINPTSNADVTIVLPITTDCTANGAVCTGDGRKLSNRLALTVSGPTDQENSAATGSPTISGTVQVGQTLAALTSGIADTDGLTNVSYSYQWLASRDTVIEGATSSTYTLHASDAGKSIKVRVTFTDDGGNEETLTSAATTAVAAAVPGAPGTLIVSVNDTGRLDLSWDAPDSNGGSAVTGYKVQWKESSDSWDTPADVSEATATGTSHTVSSLTDRVEYAFRVVAVNTAGDSSASAEASGTPRETTAPTVSSAAVDGTTLTLTFSEGLTETPLPAAATFTTNVGSNQRGVDALTISGSTVTLTLASAVTSTDGVTVSYTVPSDAAAARLKDLSDNSAASFAAQAVINNTAAVLTPLTASSHSAPASHDGQAAFTFELHFSENLEGFSYQTLQDHAFTVTGGEVAQARRLVSGSNVRWEITINPASSADVTIVLPITTDCSAEGAICTSDGRKLSSTLDLVVPGPPSNSVATGAPTISGTAQVGETLTANTSGISDTDGLANATFAYQWLADEADISGATGHTYTLADGDVGKTINVRVSFTDDAGNDEALTSAATAAVTAPEPETEVPGAAQNLEAATGNSGELAVSWDAPGSDGGSEITGYRVQWKESSGSWDTPADVSETTVTGTAHTISGLTDGTEYSVRVRAVNSEGTGEASSEAAATPVSPTPLTATTHDKPSSHDGSAAFTFELRFSEDIEGLSYTTLQEHAFTVTGGSVSKVRRLEPGKNVQWEITIQPSSDAGVTILLPNTTDCATQGAICTSDGRKLSNSLTVSVFGTGQ